MSTRNRADRALPLTIAMICLVGLLSGCSTGSKDELHSFDSASIKAKGDAFRADGREQLAVLFDDGVVDATDYELTFNAYLSCLQSRGYETSDPVLNPADGLRFILWYQSEGKSEAEQLKDEEDCGDDLREVEAMYSATAVQVMDAELRAGVIGCMQETGLEIDLEARNYPEFVQSSDQSGEWHQGFATCLGEVGQHLYPDLPYLPVGY